MKSVVFIESNTTGTGHLLAQKARRRGYEIIFLSRDPSRYPFLIEELIHPVVLDTLDVEAIFRHLQGKNDIRAVISSSEFFLETAARVAQKLGVAGSDPESIQRCRDKALLGSILTQHQVPVPRTTQVNTSEDAQKFLADLPMPVVVKPAAGSGSVGVKKCEDQSSALAHIKTLFGQKNERGLSVAGTVLIQEYVEGDEYSVEVLGLRKGLEVLGVTRKHLGEPPFFLEVGHDFPAPLDPTLKTLIEQTTLNALKATGYTYGPAHVEIRVRKNEAIVIEINPRLAGGMIPQVMQEALGVDILEKVLDLFLNEERSHEPVAARTASIRFLVPKCEGNLEAVRLPQLPDSIVSYKILRKPGDTLTLNGDFRDRLGWVIACGATVDQSASSAETFRDGTQIELKQDESQTPASPADTGRLKQTLHPEALAIVRKVPGREARFRDLSMLTAIDEAHVLMLMEQQILPKEMVRHILSEIQKLKQDGFESLMDKVAPRGIYILYEGRLNQALGSKAAGSIHTGRSRNDINATMFRMRARQLLVSVERAIWRLRSTLLLRAKSTLNAVMPIYSQYQPGLPGSFGYYLIGVEEALSRDQEQLRALGDTLGQSPLGAGAGGGTSFSIDCAFTSKLLGFKGVTSNALDAVASRDVAPRLLSALAIAGMTMSRLVEDFQLWTTREFGFLELPDNLAGGSSMMPQKKNPYLLEMIQGRAIAPSGFLQQALATMYKTPFSNSVEVGTEALKNFANGFEVIEEAATLLSLIVQNVALNQEKMKQAAVDGVVIATCCSELLVRDGGLSFKEAHYRLGAAITESIDKGENPEDAIMNLLPDQMSKPEDLSDWMNMLTYGGGPGLNVGQQLSHANSRLRKSGQSIQVAEMLEKDAEQERKRLVAAAIKPSREEEN